MSLISRLIRQYSHSSVNFLILILILLRDCPSSATQLRHEYFVLRLLLFSVILLDMEIGNNVISFLDLADNSRRNVWMDSGGDFSRV